MSSLPIHTVEMVQGSDLTAFTDRVKVARKTVANGAGGGAGVAVTVAVTGLDMPATNYIVLACPNQDATCFITSKTSTGFTLNIEPRLAANTLAAGSVDLLIFA